METEEDRRDWHDLIHPMTKGQNWYRQDILSSNKWQALTKEKLAEASCLHEVR
jgi:hypothetical protein